MEEPNRKGTLISAPTEHESTVCLDHDQPCHVPSWLQGKRRGNGGEVRGDMEEEEAGRPHRYGIQITRKGDFIRSTNRSTYFISPLWLIVF